MNSYGYDYSMGLTIDVVNKMLQSNLANTNLTINYSNKDAQSGIEVTIDAVMEPWQLVSGGSNKLLRFNIPFKSGTISAPPSITANTDISTVSVVVEVTMSWLGAGNAIQNQGSGNCTQLVFSPDPNAIAGAAGYVACISISDSSNKLSQLPLQILKEVMPDLLYQNKSNLQFVMASMMAEPTGFPSWVKPTSWDYFYIENSNMNLLCFLCMLGTDPLPATPSFDTSVFVTGSNSFLLISIGSVFFQMINNPSAVQSSEAIEEDDYTVSSQESRSIDENGFHFSISCTKPANQFPGIPPDSDGTPYPDDSEITYSYSYSTVRVPSFDYSKQNLFFIENPPIASIVTSDYVSGWDNFTYNSDRLNNAFQQCYNVVASQYPSSVDNYLANGLSGLLSIGGDLTSLQNLIELSGGNEKLTLNNAGINGEVFFIQGTL